FCYHLKKTVAESHRMLIEAYGEHVLSKSQCFEWFKKFKSSDFDVRNEECGNHRKSLGEPLTSTARPNHYGGNKTVLTKDADEGVPDIRVIGPGGVSQPVQMSKTDATTYKCHYTPVKEGRHVIMITYGGKEIPKSPFEVNVGPYKESNIKAFGPDLHTPSKAKIECNDNGDGTADVSYLPTAPGQYVEVYGPEIQSEGVAKDEPTNFTIDAREAGQAALEVAIQDELPISLMDNEDGTYVVDYMPPQPGNYTVNLNYGGLKVPQCPIKINVQPHVDVSKVDGLAPNFRNIFYQGLSSDVLLECESVRCFIYNGAREFLTVDTHTISLGATSIRCSRAVVPSRKHKRITQEAGRAADFQVAITTPSGNRIKAHVVPTHEGYLVNFTPIEPISNQPYRLTCVHGSDPGKVRASGPGLSHGVVNKPAEFVIDMRGAGQGSLGVTVEDPCEAAINCRDNGDGTCSVAYLPTETSNGINITFNEQHVSLIFKEHAHIRYSCIYEMNFSNVFVKKKRKKAFEFLLNHIVLSRFAYGPSLEQGITDKTNYFTVETKDQVPRKVVVQDLGDGKYKATYLPDDCGRYKVNVKYGGKKVPNSPVQSTSISSANNCKIKEGIQHTLAQGEKYCITMDTENAGRGAVTCRIRSTTGSEIVDIDIEDNGDGTVNIYYTVADAGDILSIKGINHRLIPIAIESTNLTNFKN
ncbi:Filamin-B, partial [Atta colombica]